VICYFCAQPIAPGEPVEHHHPDKARFPDWTEPAHRVCHRRYHARPDCRNGTPPVEWRGRRGYDEVVKAWPGWHRMGGLARSRQAERDERGRFIK
jgi:hypothetical protein